MNIRYLETLRFRAATLFLVGLMALFVSLQLRADGSETLGPPSIDIASGTGIIASGTGLISEPGTINLEIPKGENVEIKQVILYWEGFGSPNGDSTILIGETEINGTLIGGPNRFFSNHHSSTYRADITNFNLIAKGANSLLVSGLEFAQANNGAGIMVIIDDGSGLAEIQYVDGDDTAFNTFPDPRQTTVAQTFSYLPAAVDRLAPMSMFFGSVAGKVSASDPIRPSTILVTINGEEQEFNDLLGSLDGDEWDTLNIQVVIPALSTSLTVQALSQDSTGSGNNPASFVWIATGMSIPPPPMPSVEICTLVTLNPDMISEFSDADSITLDGCDVFDQSIPVGKVGDVDATYRLKLTNTGTETLTNVRINSADFGLADVAIPDECGDLDPGEMCIINFDDDRFNEGKLKVPGICKRPGNIIKMATVDAEGIVSNIPVTDVDPAVVDCTVEPRVTIRKEVSLNGGPFVDANTAAEGPSGILGADAVYRFIIENTGTEVLINVVISDEVLGLENVSIPEACGDLVPKETCEINFSDDDFSNLSVLGRCDTIGEKLNTAKVDAIGEFTGIAVADEDPAYIQCQEPQIMLLKEISIDGVNYFAADNSDDPDVPVGIVGQTNASYRLIVKNIGSETLVDVKITDTTLGLDNVAVPGGPLSPGDERTIVSGDIDFGVLFVSERCGSTPGNKSNVASVLAIGEDTGARVSDDNPANVRCITGPEILLLKEVSLAGGEFVAADTAAEAPVGLLGDDAIYRFIVRNIGDEDLTNIKVSDSTLGLTEVLIPDLAIGTEHVIEVGSFIDLTDEFNKLSVPGRCDSVGTLLNIASVSAEGVITNEPVQDDNPANVVCEAPVICELSVDKTCTVETPPSDNLLCTSAIAATTLRYTGPDLSNATVTFQGKSGFAEYTDVNLVSNETVLTMANQNGFTVDATVDGDGFGSKTTITINGEVEIIHTSCSAIYVAGQPAPLDGNTPNPPNSTKGDPSPNWFVVNFKQKDGIFIEEASIDGQPGTDSCTVPFGGGNVTYNYAVKNIGSTDVNVTSVYDDKIGEILTTVPTLLGSGASLNLNSELTSIHQLTTNTVLVDANVTENSSIECAATDAVTTTVEEAPLLSCADGKPISLVFEYTGGECEAEPGNNQEGKFECSGTPNAGPVQLVVEKGIVDPSDESIEIGDFVTVTARDKFDSQTDFAIMQNGQVVQDLGIHLSCSKEVNVGDRFGSLTLRVFVPKGR